MVSAVADVEINREPEVVFGYFADLRNEPEWNRGHVRNVTMTSPGPVGLGSTFEGDHFALGKATWRLTEYDWPRHLVVEGRVGSGTYRYAGDLLRQDGATIFRGHIEWEPQGLWRMLGPVLHVLLSIQTKRSFRRLRERLNRG